MVCSGMDDIKAAFLDLLRSLGADPSTPIDILKLGPPLVGGGFNEDQIVNLLFYLESLKSIELLPGNRLRIMKPLDQLQR